MAPEPGGVLRVIQARLRDHFGGSALALIPWIDKIHPEPAPGLPPGP
jgi:hypothetical protein